MTVTNYRKMCVALVAAVLAGPAAAGEFQLGFRLGQTWLDIDGDRLSSGDDVNEDLVNLGLTASYRWDGGALIEAGLGGSGGIDVFGIQDVDHHWIGGGWQFDLEHDFKLTPRAGLSYSHLTSSEEDLFDSEPVDEFKDWVPYVELTLERRFWRHVGLGLYFRDTFEDWGDTRDFGVSLSWTFL